MKKNKIFLAVIAKDISAKTEKELRFAAELRQKNPEASLSELVKLSGNTITKSGLNHRLSRLVTIAKTL